MTELTQQSNFAVNKNKWQWKDNIWTLGLYGTAVGAGTLFLPVEIGTQGLVIFLVMLLLGLPLSLIPHQLLCRVYMKEVDSGTSELPIFGTFFKGKGEVAIKLFYCLAFFPVTLVFGVSLVNALDHYLEARLNLDVINRGMLSFIVIAGLYLVLSKGRDIVVGIMSALALPFAAAILIIAVMQIPGWDVANLTHAVDALEHLAPATISQQIWLTLPLITFAFCCAPMVSPLTAHYMEKNAGGGRKALLVIKIAYLAIFASIIFFVLSCFLSIPQSTFETAKAHNLNVLSVMVGDENASLISYIAPFIAIVGMTKSFLGVGLSVAGTLSQLASDVSGLSEKFARRIAWLLMFSVTFIIVYVNPNVITMIETVCGPLIAIIVFLIPAWLVYSRDELSHLRNGKTLLVLISGIATLSAIFYSIV